MTLKADRDALVNAAAGWYGVSGECTAARTKMLEGDGQGSKFGALAALAGVDSQHDTFVTSMLDALAQAANRMTQIGDALRDTAADYGATDLDVADAFHNEDGTPA